MPCNMKHQQRGRKANGGHIVIDVLVYIEEMEKYQKEPNKNENSLHKIPEKNAIRRSILRTVIGIKKDIENLKNGKWQNQYKVLCKLRGFINVILNDRRFNHQDYYSHQDTSDRTDNQ